MEISREAQIVSGVTLISVPTIMYGGVTLLGVLTGGDAGMRPEGLVLSDTQWALFRAGHAHAGVWVILSLVLQLLLDAATLSVSVKWLARVSAPIAAVAVSGGFFGIAFDAGFRWLLYFGGLCLAVAVVVTAVGLLRRPRAGAVPRV